MLPDLKFLIRLQELDSAAERLRRRMADLPAAQAALETRLANLTAAVAGVKERIAASQTSRRDTEKDLAAVQARLSKYKDQLMEVKTNKEYHAMQTEITAAETLVRREEDRLLERMEEAELFAAELKAAEAALKSGQSELKGSLQQMETDRVATRAGTREDGSRARAGLGGRVAWRARALRAGVEAPQRAGDVRSQGGAVHPVPRQAPPAGVQRASPQRERDAVRELFPDPLLPCGARRLLPLARRRKRDQRPPSPAPSAS